MEILANVSDGLVEGGFLGLDTVKANDPVVTVIESKDT